MMFRGLARTYKCTVRIVPYYSSIYFAKVSSYCKAFVRFICSEPNYQFLSNILRAAIVFSLSCSQKSMGLTLEPIVYYT